MVWRLFQSPTITYKYNCLPAVLGALFSALMTTKTYIKSVFLWNIHSIDAVGCMTLINTRDHSKHSPLLIIFPMLPRNFLGLWIYHALRTISSDPVKEWLPKQFTHSTSSKVPYCRAYRKFFTNFSPLSFYIQCTRAVLWGSVSWRIESISASILFKYRTTMSNNGRSLPLLDIKAASTCKSTNYTTAPSPHAHTELSPTYTHTTHTV